VIRIEPRVFVAGPSAAHAAINGGLVMWIFLHFFPIGWPQLNAVYEHGLAWARSQAF
jgi:nitric oxide reductase subunit B